TGLGKMAERTLAPSLQMLRTVPLLSLIPLFILWFGIGEFSKILMISLGAFFPMYVNTFLGIRNVDAKLYEVSRIFQYSKPQLLIRLIVPAALPNILLGIRLSLGVSWLVLVVAEMMGTSA
ncbi:ABC transporter permease subunit, partial [Clostridium perfringens]